MIMIDDDISVIEDIMTNEDIVQELTEVTEKV